MTTTKPQATLLSSSFCSTAHCLLLLPYPPLVPLRQLASRQHSLFVHWAAKNFTLTLLSGHQAVCAYFPIPLFQLSPLCHPLPFNAVAAAAAAATTEAKFRFGRFRKFTVDSEDSLEERERERDSETVRGVAACELCDLWTLNDSALLLFLLGTLLPSPFSLLSLFFGQSSFCSAGSEIQLI